jgi:hypothetical protein
LAIERQVIGVFLHQDVGDRRFRWQPAFNEPRWRGGLDDAVLALTTRVFRPTRHQHAVLRRDDIQPLGAIFTNDMERPATAGAGFVIDIDDDLDTWQMRGQLSALLRCAGLA